MVESISYSLQIGAVFEIFSLSLFGVALPFVIIYYRNMTKRIDHSLQSRIFDARGTMEDIRGNTFNTMKAVSVGVMLGLAMMHLFPDADANLTTIYPEYPLANVLVCLGIILVLSVDQIATSLWKSLQFTQANKTIDSAKAINTISWAEHGHDHDHGQDCVHDHPNGICDLRSHSSSDSAVSLSVPHSHDHDHESHNENCGFMTCEHDASKFSGCDAAEDCEIGIQKVTSASDEQVDRDLRQSFAIIDASQSQRPVKGVDSPSQLLHLDLGIDSLGLMQEESFKDLLVAYIMEISIAAHSIIIGVNLGLLGENDISSIVALMIAVGFHQAVEGFSLGAQIAASYYSGSEVGLVGLDRRKVLLFMIIFSCSTPLGVMIGMLSQSQQESDGQVAAKGVANAIATGSLLYVALVEMLPDLFEREHGPPFELSHAIPNPCSSNPNSADGSPCRDPNLSSVSRRGMGPTRTAIQILGISLGVAFMALLAVWA